MSIIGEPEDLSGARELAAQDGSFVLAGTHGRVPSVKTLGYLQRALESH